MPHNFLHFLYTRHSLLHIIPDQMQLLHGKTAQIKETTRNWLHCGEPRTGERKIGPQVNVVRWSESSKRRLCHASDFRKRRDIEDQPKKISIGEFQIKQQLHNFLQIRYISFHCEHKKKSALWIGKTKAVQHGCFGGLSIGYFASWHSCSLFSQRILIPMKY